LRSFSFACVYFLLLAFMRLYLNGQSTCGCARADHATNVKLASSALPL
jgi:hypothetical protein